MEIHVEYLRNGTFVISCCFILRVGSKKENITIKRTSDFQKKNRNIAKWDGFSLNFLIKFFKQKDNIIENLGNSFEWGKSQPGPLTVQLSGFKLHYTVLVKNYKENSINIHYPKVVLPKVKQTRRRGRN